MRNLMEAYQQKVLESVEGAKQFADEVRKLYRKYFPKSFIEVDYRTSLSPHITARIALGKDKTEWSNGIVHNDPMHTIFMIEFEGSSALVGDGGMKVERISGGGLLGTNYERIKVPFRKTSGDRKQILTTLERYFDRLKDAVKANADNLKTSGTNLVPSEKVR